MAKQRSFSRTAQFWIGLLISIICVAAVLWMVDLDQVGRALTGADWRLAIAAVVMGQTCFLLLRALRWKIMLSGVESESVRGEPDIGYWSFFHAQNVGYLVTILLPFRLGDLARSYIIGQHPGASSLQALSSVVLERILDMLMIIAFFGIAAPGAPVLPESIQIAAAVFSAIAAAGFLAIILAATYRKRVIELFRQLLTRIKLKNVSTWMERVERFLDGFKTLTNWRMLFSVITLSIVLWSCIAVAYYLGIKTCWPGVTWPAALIALSAAAFGVSAPSSPGSVGVFHGAVVLGLSAFPLTREAALSFAVVYHAAMYITNLVLGLIGLFKSGHTFSGIMAGVRSLQGAR